jgi:hypothetical protein
LVEATFNVVETPGILRVSIRSSEIQDEGCGQVEPRVEEVYQRVVLGHVEVLDENLALELTLLVESLNLKDGVFDLVPSCPVLVNH